MTRLRDITILANLIERLEPEPYVFDGYCWLESTPNALQPLKFNCEFTHDGEALVADWNRGPFEIRIPFRKSSLHRAVAELFIQGFGHMRGQLSFVGSQVLYYGSAELATLFAHICFEESGVVNVVGTYELNGLRHLFSISGGIAPGPAAVANVQSIARRRA